MILGFILCAKNLLIMADYRTLALAFLLIGFELDLFGISASESRFVGDEHTVEALMICGFLAYLVACMLLLFVKYGELGASRAAIICGAVFALAAGALIVVGLGVYCSKVNDEPPPYPTTLLACGALFGLLGGLFLCLEICRC